MFCTVNESISAMENAQVIDILYITFLKSKSNRMLFRYEMNCVESLGLSFCQGRDV